MQSILNVVDIDKNNHIVKEPCQISSLFKRFLGIITKTLLR